MNIVPPANRGTPRGGTMESGPPRPPPGGRPGGPPRLASGGRQASMARLTGLASGTASARCSNRGESAVSCRQMNRLGLRNNRLKVKTEGDLPTIFEEFIEYTPH